MEDALKRLRALQQDLESLHRTTARVLAESEQLIGALESPPVLMPVVADRPPRRSRAKSRARQRKPVR